VASLSQGRTAAAQCGLFTHKSVPVIFEPPCIYTHVTSRNLSLSLSLSACDVTIGWMVLLAPETVDFWNCSCGTNIYVCGKSVLIVTAFTVSNISKA